MCSQCGSVEPKVLFPDNNGRAGQGGRACENIGIVVVNIFHST